MLGPIILGLLIMVCGYFGSRTLENHETRIDAVEKGQIQSAANQAKIEVRLDSLKDNISDIKSGVKDLGANFEQLRAEIRAGKDRKP